MVVASLSGLNQKRVLRNLVSGNQVARGIAQRVGAVSVHLIGNRALIAIREIVITEGLRRGIELDGQKVAYRSGAVIGARRIGAAGSAATDKCQYQGNEAEPIFHGDPFALLSAGSRIALGRN